ncbi:MAG: T9SS type A sorting domain-containing protein [Bacteroidales bacterium]|nr:T9SS type A sorting domain-containing protein [Bacteroidales bacterium]
MTYNLLNFNNNTSYCTQNNNPINNKKIYLKTISQYVMPDIIGFNEVGANNANIQLILDSILNVGTSKIYGRIPYINSSNSDIVSTVFYNTNKFALHSTNFLQTGLRDVIIANLYYKSLELQNQQDTVFVRVIVAHLKAGSTSSDQQQRAQETQIIMNYLNNLGSIKNTILMGDLNVNASTEQAFQNLINHSNIAIRFYDPVNKLGNWHDNASFALYHTQAAQLNSNGCTSGGGLDDRFDFILASFGIMNKLYKVEYLNNSYKVIGQDGNRLNMGVDNPENYSVPNDVLIALANMSDHLPVTLKLVVHQTPQISVEKNPFTEWTVTPVSWQKNVLTFKSNINEKIQLKIINTTGNTVFEGVAYATETEFSIQTPDAINGIYIIEITNSNFRKYYKILKTE